MPVTARLLQRLHETIGDEATNDLLAWWEEATTVNRVAVREVADLYYVRFGDHLERGLAEVRADLERGLAEVRADLDRTVTKVQANLDRGLAEVRTDLDRRVTEVQANLDRGLAGVRAEMSVGFAQLRAELAAQRADLIKWMFLFWAGTVIPLAGLLVALLKL
jgi:hypothetical protein